MTCNLFTEHFITNLVLTEYFCEEDTRVDLLLAFLFTAQFHSLCLMCTDCRLHSEFLNTSKRQQIIGMAGSNMRKNCFLW